MTTLGILHPGSMGAAVAAQVVSAGTEVLWYPEGRSEATKDRATRAGLTAVDTITEMAHTADVILSLCPPANAVEVAHSVAAHSFSGVYVDGNAISPANVKAIGAIVASAGAQLVDGSVIGSPPSATKSPRLYLSGPESPVEIVAGLFEGTTVNVITLQGGLGKASALKLSYSTFQKASRVLAAVSHALARDWGVDEQLVDIARDRTSSYLAETTYIPKVAARAWRWAPEMREAESSLAETSLPTELVAAAAAVMERWKDAKDLPMELPEALERLHEMPD
ncbi:NAD(P)-dependent oxidoreductase [Streptomyces luteoverticillatus]|uniref:NAD(P)-dependent oxidoreductase n=1 Tax=Streptomyces luteoverticillatus TaxID=66425 RepID=A0A3S9PML0_STRLT|nr:DUF1932 domain-containing protein [Streptomyces luteoverticillatus]AZQ73534.1 NAD(P)-dependent oxidoreductase [Streptomyces luteoverticillatus]